MAGKVKYSRLSLLMLISYIMLSVFVARWLFIQFDNEKTFIKKEWNSYYMNSVSKVIDTILVEYVIIPNFEYQTEVNFTDHIGFTNVKDSIKLNIERNYNHPDSVASKHTVISLSVSDTSNVHIIPGSSNNQTFSLNDILIKSTRMFMDIQTDTSDENHWFDSLNSAVYTNLFKNIFVGYLDDNKMNLNLVWSTDTTEQYDFSKISTGINDIQGNIFPRPYFLHIGWFVIKRIFPQILFALILLIFTFLAFYLAHISLKKQIMLNDMRKDFIRNMTHELKTPVSTIKVAVEAMKSENISSNPGLFSNYLSMSELEIERLEKLINRSLQHSLLEDNIAFLDKEEFNIADLINETIDSLMLFISKQNASVSFENAKPVLVTADKLLVQEILINLIDNSLKYASPDCLIKILVKETKDSVLLKFSDSGPGIPEKYLKQVFDKFFRVPTGDKHNIKGYGLGLSFVSIVMQNHGGKVEVKNNPEGGCSFLISFPKLNK